MYRILDFKCRSVVVFFIIAATYNNTTAVCFLVVLQIRIENNNKRSVRVYMCIVCVYIWAHTHNLVYIADPLSSNSLAEKKTIIYTRKQQYAYDSDANISCI